MKYNKIRSEMMPEGLERDILDYRKYFIFGRLAVIILSVPTNGFHSLIFRYGTDFKRSRNRKRYIVSFWKRQAYQNFYKLWDNA